MISKITKADNLLGRLLILKDKNTNKIKVIILKKLLKENKNF